MIILVVMIIMIIVVTCVHAEKEDSEGKGTTGLFFARFLESLNIFVVLVVVAIPEGL